MKKQIFIAAVLLPARLHFILLMAGGLTAYCLLSTGASAQWTQTNGPYRGTVICIASDGTNIFAWL